MKTNPRIHARPLLLAAALAALSFGAAGCGMLDTSSHGSVVAWIQGTLEVNLGADYEKVYRATQGALKDLQFTPVSDKKDALNAELVARTALDKKVEITLTKAGERVTKVEIHIGVVGDQDMSQLVLERIKRGL